MTFGDDLKGLVYNSIQNSEISILSSRVLSLIKMCNFSTQDKFRKQRFGNNTVVCCINTCRAPRLLVCPPFFYNVHNSVLILSKG